MLQFELVVPAYNEAESLKQLISQTVSAAQASGFTSETFQLVVVDNGSSDGTKDFLAAHKQTSQAQWYRVVTEEVNRGYGAGVGAGLASTTAPIVGYTHADLQCDPKDAFRAYSICKDAGPKTFVRSRRTKRARKDQMVSHIFAMTVRCALRFNMDEINAQPKVFPQDIVSALDKAPKDFAFDLFVLYQAARRGYTFKTLSVFFPPRPHGVSKWASTLVGRHRTFAKMFHYIWTLRKEHGPLS